MRMPALAAAAAAALALGAGAAHAAPARAIYHDVASSNSSNWAGYAVTASGTTFTSVSGSWTQPAVSCANGSSYSAFWVGLGGFSTGSQALEQIGTEADCSGPNATYTAWYELVPAPSVRVQSLSVAAGDVLNASVSVSGTTATLTLNDVTSGVSFSQTFAVASPDTSSAEWIAEAPSSCGGSGSRCQTLPLANFGSVGFTGASATTAAGHTGTISDPSFTATAVTLQGSSPFRFGRRFAFAQPVTSATPSSLSSDGGSFTVTVQQQSVSVPSRPRSRGWGGWGGRSF